MECRTGEEQNSDAEPAEEHTETPPCNTSLNKEVAITQLQRETGQLIRRMAGLEEKHNTEMDIVVK